MCSSDLDLVVTDERGDGFERRSGVAMLFRGSSHPSATPALLFKGEKEGDGFGRWVANAGDVDGDGHPDLAIAAWWSDNGAPGSGAVFLYHGGPRMSTLPMLRIPGPASEMRFGTAIANAGDLDGDGFGDLLIGAPAQSHTVKGGAFLVRFHRYCFTRPRPDERWRAGSPAVVSWQGREPADLEWSSDGAHWNGWLAHAGGKDDNVAHANVPREAVGPIHLRLRPADQHVRGGAALDSVLVAGR